MIRYVKIEAATWKGNKLEGVSNELTVANSPTDPMNDDRSVKNPWAENSIG